MRKIYFALLAITVALVSCNDAKIGTIYDQEEDYFAFASAKVVGYELTADNDYGVKCKIVRTNSSDTASVEVELAITEDIDGLFDLDNIIVTFDAGSYEEYATIVLLEDVSELDPEKTYEFSLSLIGENVSNFYSTTSYSAVLKLDEDQ